MSRLPFVRLNELDSLATESWQVRRSPRLRDRVRLPAISRRLSLWVAAGLIVNMLVGLLGATVVHGQDPESAQVRSWLATNVPSVAQSEPESFWALLVGSFMALAVPKKGRAGRTLALALISLPGLLLLIAAVVLFVVLVVRAIPQLVGMAIETADELL